jgi:hypothetical protein
MAPAMAQQQPATGAVILVDERLHEPLAPLLAEYAAAAGRRRGFAIEVLAIDGLDDEPFAALRERVRRLRAQNGSLEGVLFAGNVKLPSLFSPRGDNLQTRYFVHALEDLDLELERRLAPGSVRPGAADDAQTVPEHDFDWLDRGKTGGVELWAAFLPVGLGDSARDHHAEWARQLTPFLHKAIAFHRGATPVPRRLYKVSNQLWDLAPAWRHYGPARIDFHAVNPLAKGKVPPGTPAERFCPLPPEQAYVRAPLQRFASYEEFAAWYGDHEWMGEGWQQGSILLAHLNERAYDVAWLNVHSNETFSLVDEAAARAVQRGALVMLLSGCGVGGFRQPGNPAFTDTQVAPGHNVLCAWVYGSSMALAALGDPFNRGHESYFERMIGWLCEGEYLGRAHRRRMELHHEHTGSADELKENVMEIVVGDPFVDLRAR